MNIKIYKKIFIVLTISLGIIGVVGCESLDNVKSQNKIYTNSDIKKEIKTSLENIMSQSFITTKELFSNKDLDKNDLSCIKNLSDKIQSDEKLFDKISNNTNSNESKNLAESICNSYKKIRDSINEFIKEIKADKAKGYTKATNDILVEITKLYSIYSSIK
ncbi:hypothetical protein H8891_07765 [Paeniclostridium sp. NSJ-45]|uniref:Chemotaxis methyl-accepting receptor HlyB-like 4HB MCP domain-containing protein n=1 Tax=Paeniclostridium hominis TaxID=2764329 RepID=A0ABR7K3T5_9FIRM|nr:MULTISPECIES: MCP four helix bundle domain-containing protein [Paeniclostridium]MBC6003696.1 hypothetical protein [Paeniclostridium hominis]